MKGKNLGLWYIRGKNSENGASKTQIEVTVENDICTVLCKKVFEINRKKLKFEMFEKKKKLMCKSTVISCESSIMRW